MKWYCDIISWYHIMISNHDVMSWCDIIISPHDMISWYLEASGGIWGASGGQRRLGGKMCQNMCVFLSKVARATISRRREQPDPHEVRSLHTKVAPRSPVRIPRITQSPTPNRQDPNSREQFGEIKSGDCGIRFQQTYKHNRITKEHIGTLNEHKLESVKNAWIPCQKHVQMPCLWNRGHP